MKTKLITLLLIPLLVTAQKKNKVVSEISPKKEIKTEIFIEKKKGVIIGRITDIKDNSLVGVSIKDKIMFDNNTEITSDYDGSFKINVTEQPVEFSMIYIYIKGYNRIILKYSLINSYKIDFGNVILIKESGTTIKEVTIEE